MERFSDLVEWHTMGEGFTWETQDRQRDIAAAGRAWGTARKLMDDPSIRLLVLDDLTSHCVTITCRCRRFWRRSVNDVTI